jgi:hypothetical protein
MEKLVAMSAKEGRQAIEPLLHLCILSFNVWELV